MSLTAFLKLPDVRERFENEFKIPPLGVTRELLAPPLSKNSSLVGTAFDYLLRFYIERLNSNSVTTEWIAEQAALCDIEFADCSVSLPDIAAKAKEAHAAYLKSGTMDDNLLRQTICLAQLDVVYRRGLLWGGDDSYFKTIGQIDPKDVEDLRHLISLVQPETFKSSKVCVLNATFGPASKLMGGADCDLVVDDALIDAKTIRDFKVQRSHFDQLMGYYVLSRISGVTGAPKGHTIKRLGIYFSRHGYLWFFRVADVVKEEQMPELISWFKKRAKA
jgi:hypothetical protein